MQDDKTAIRTDYSQQAVPKAQQAYLTARHEDASRAPYDPTLYTPAAKAAWQPLAVRTYHMYLVALGVRYVVAHGPRCDQAVIAFWHDSGLTFDDEQQAARDLMLHASVELSTGAGLGAQSTGGGYNIDNCGSCSEVVDDNGGQDTGSAADWAAGGIDRVRHVCCSGRLDEPGKSPRQKLRRVR
jgi:hypothetical protein